MSAARREKKRTLARRYGQTEQQLFTIHHYGMPHNPLYLYDGEDAGMGDYSRSALERLRSDKQLDRVATALSDLEAATKRLLTALHLEHLS